MNKRLSTILQYLFFLGLGIFLVWLSIKDIDDEKWGQINDALANARFYLIGPVFIILFLSHYVRALRWRLLIEPLGYKPDKNNMFFAVLIGYLTNQAIPRLGEIVKCTVLARYEKLPADKLIGTIILERLIDALSLLLVFGITLLSQPGLYGRLVAEVFNANPQAEETKSIPGYVLPLIIAGILVIAIVIWMLVKKKKISDLVQVFKKIGTRVWQGLGSIRHLKKRGQFILLTVVLWTLYLLGGYIGFMAFRETQQYGIKEAFTVLSAGSIGMIVTPGGIGAYSFLIEKTMQLYGLKQSIAFAFGWILWLAQTAVILLGGLISFILLPLYNNRKAIKPTGII